MHPLIELKGWGKFLPDYISLATDNEAIAGRSARSYTREGRFNTIAGQVKSGDYVSMCLDRDIPQK